MPGNAAATALERLRFDNRALQSLPIDSQKGNAVRQVAGACFSLVTPTPVQSPVIVAVSPAALREIGLSEAAARDNEASFAEYFSGNRLFIGSEPAAHCYCGHQFGSFAGQLGDGAAMYLGEIVDADSGGHLAELQLKGAGPTPYSRSADGRKVLRSSIREFLASEAMWALGIPTTRAVSVITSDTTVERDPLYTGKVIQERCTVVARTAPTFIRFGSFEICKPEDDTSDRHGPSVDEPEILTTLFDFVARTYYPAELQLAREAVENSGDADAVRAKACELIFAEITKRTAALVAQWQCVGFCHGVLNTDNMSIVGLTIDYGPYAFMGYFDENHVSNHSDTDGRYSYKNQPSVCKWNLHRLADAWGIMCPTLEAQLHGIVDSSYDELYAMKRRELMAAKLGVSAAIAAKSAAAIDELDKAVFEALQSTAADMTDTFRLLRRIPVNPKDASELDEVIRATAAEIAAVCAPPTYTSAVCQRKLARGRPQIHPTQIQQLLALAEENPTMLQQMFGNPPLGALVAHLKNELEKWERIRAEQDRLAELRATDALAKKATDLATWKRVLERYAVALKDIGVTDGAERQALMRQSNPIFTLRPWILRDATEAAERGPREYNLIQQLVDRVLHPFDEDERDGEEWMMTAPPDASGICVSCSS